MMKIKNGSFHFTLWLIFGFCSYTFCQPASYTTRNAHAHNDYENKVPFQTAFDAGFGSIEADVFPINGRLYVAHDKKSIDSARTLSSLYLAPLLKRAWTDDFHQLILLVDIKENYPEALSILQKELKPLKKLIKNKLLTIIISGTRPAPSEFRKYPNYIQFDDDQSKISTRKQWKRVGLVSLRFSRLTSWKGKGEILPDDLARLKKTIDSVHLVGKKIRFWAAPDNPISWKLQMDLKADLIGTDKILELSEFIRREYDSKFSQHAPASSQ